MKVAIIASGQGKYAAPMGDEWEWWGVNQTYTFFNHEILVKRFTRWFELHRRAYLAWETAADYYKQHLHWLTHLTDNPSRLYVQDVSEWPDASYAPNAFPFADVQALAPAFRNYHACSIDWMLAYAIHLGATDIGLYGVEQDHTSEPIGSRACVEFWAGFATARGIKVTSADGSTFKLAHLCYTKTAYAFDPAWLPWEDRTNGDGYITQARVALAKAVAPPSPSVGFHRE